MSQNNHIKYIYCHSVLLKPINHDNGNTRLYVDYSRRFIIIMTTVLYFIIGYQRNNYDLISNVTPYSKHFSNI